MPDKTPIVFVNDDDDDEVLLSAIQHALERSRAALVRERERQALCDCYASLTARER